MFRKVAFVNAKGGVGKSTLATLTSLSLASRFPDSSVALLDLDKQATSSKALRKFENSRLSVVGSHEFMLESGMPNNSYLASYMSDISSYVKVENSSLDNFLIVDSPAGADPQEYSFLRLCDFVFIPLSVSDADMDATRVFLSRLLQGMENFYLSAKIVLIPNQIETREDFNEIRTTFTNAPILLGQPIWYSKEIRRTFRPDFDDHTLISVLKMMQPYYDWMIDLILGKKALPSRNEKLFQI